MNKFTWQVFALGSAFFAGLTAILGKVGVTEINSNLATLIRTVVILGITALLVTARGEWEPLNKLSGRGITFLCLLSSCPFAPAPEGTVGVSYS